MPPRRQNRAKCRFESMNLPRPGGSLRLANRPPFGPSKTGSRLNAAVGGNTGLYLFVDMVNSGVCGMLHASVGNRNAERPFQLAS